MSSLALSMKGIAGPAGGRVRAVDGLRGWAAVMVLMFHLTWEAYGVLIPALRNPLTAGFMGSSQSIAIFFVLSGVALSTSFFRTGSVVGTIEAAWTRYPRLVLPLLGAMLVTWALFALWPPMHREAAVVLGRGDWMSAWLPEPLRLGAVVRFALWDVFDLWTFASGTSPNPMLWTIKYEAVGSLLVFACVGLSWANRRVGEIAIGGLFVAFVVARIRGDELSGHLACFLFGMFLARLTESGGLEAFRKWCPEAVSTAAPIVLVVGDGTLGALGYPRLPLVTAMLVVFFLLASRTHSNLLGGPVSQFLARVSYPLFLLQFPIIVTVTCGAVLLADRWGWPAPIACAVIAVGSFALTLGLAVLFQPVDDLTRRFCRWWIGWGRRRLGLPERASTAPSRPS